MAISLSSGVRQSLQSLQATAVQAQSAQQHLATGKKVNSAIDSPVNYFTAQNLNNRADAFSGLLDGISNSIQTLKAASNGIDAISKQVKSLQATVKQAQADAASNRPTATAASNVAGVAVANSTTSRDAALDTKLVDAGGTAGAGVAANSVVSLSAGSTTYTFKTSATDTVRDLVNNINKSGIASASVDSRGALTVTGSGSDSLKFSVNDGASTPVDETAKLGFSAAQVTSFASGISSTSNSSVRANLVDQFNDARNQLDQLAKDAGFNGTNLLAGDKLTTVFNEKTGANQSKLDIQGQTVSSDNLGIGKAGAGGTIDFQNDTDLSKAADSLTNALSSLQSLSSTLGSSLSTVQTRQDFSKSLIDTLKNGADNLVNADTNEEGANLLALQTRQSLSQTALSLSSQADQAVLKLF
jgi:flagellin-like hook-associated protein FlgL